MEVIAKAVKPKFRSRTLPKGFPAKSIPYKSSTERFWGREWSFAITSLTMRIRDVV